MKERGDESAAVDRCAASSRRRPFSQQLGMLESEDRRALLEARSGRGVRRTARRSVLGSTTPMRWIEARGARRGGIWAGGAGNRQPAAGSDRPGVRSRGAPSPGPVLSRALARGCGHGLGLRVIEGGARWGRRARARGGRHRPRAWGERVVAPGHGGPGLGRAWPGAHENAADPVDLVLATPGHRAARRQLGERGATAAARRRYLDDRATRGWGWEEMDPAHLAASTALSGTPTSANRTIDARVRPRARRGRAAVVRLLPGTRPADRHAGIAVRRSPGIPSPGTIYASRAQADARARQRRRSSLRCHALPPVLPLTGRGVEDRRAGRA